MWVYKKYLEFPVNITKPDLKFRSLLFSTIGGAQGELNAAIRYFMQSATMPTLELKNLLIEIATEEMGHVEILYALINGLSQGKDYKDYKACHQEALYSEIGNGIAPTNNFGNQYTTAYLSITGDPIADLAEDMAAEEKARASYEHLMDLTDNEEILAPLSFLRQREIVHYQRFKEAYYKLKNKE